MMIDNDTKNTGQVELETDFNKNKNISTTKFPTISLYNIFRKHCTNILEDAKVALQFNVIRLMQEWINKLTFMRNGSEESTTSCPVDAFTLATALLSCKSESFNTHGNQMVRD